jgi:hypothetical protein
MRTNRVAAFAISAALIIAGCHKRTPVAARAPVPLPSVVPRPVPPPPVTPAPEPLPPIAPPPPDASPLEPANRAFASGNYDEAARLYENYLRATHSGGQRDQALFYLGLSYVLRPAPATDWQRGAMTFKQLIDEYPNSPFKTSANLILSLHAQLDEATANIKQRDQKMKQLTTELDRLKKIDADRRKRP